MASRRNPKPRRHTSRTRRRSRRVQALHGNPLAKAVTFHSDGSRTIELTGQGTDLMRKHMDETRDRFQQVYGREMRGDDPVFPDWNSPVPAPVSAAAFEAELVAAMMAADLDHALIYAYQQSGVLVTEENQNIVDPLDLAEWDAALDRYHALHSVVD